MNSFYAGVELLSHPELSDKPAAVCGDPESRHGIILAKNQPAKKYGIVTAETVWQAKRKCPGLVLLPAHHEKYNRFYKIINSIYGRYTNMVEPFSIDESWLDVTASKALFGDGKTIADEIRHTVKKETGLTLSAGVSFNKFFAKMGSDYRKPDATTVITRENYRNILWPLDISAMFMVGKATERKLKKSGIMTIGDLAVSDRDFLISALGSFGGALHDYANGKDDRPVAFEGEKKKIKSVGNGMTFPKDLTSSEELRTAALALSDKACARLRKHRLKAGGVKVDIKDPAFHVISRQMKLPFQTDTREDIFRGAMKLINSSVKEGSPVRLLTVTCIYLSDKDADEQLSFFHDSSESPSHEKESHINDAIDDIRKRFGSSSITYGRVMGSSLSSGRNEKNGS